MKFVPKYCLPDRADNNKYYLLKRASAGENGWNPCIDVSREKDSKAKYKSKDYKGCANCVWLANARFNESQHRTKDNWLLGSWNARDFIKNATAKGLKTGKVPKVGAVMVWGGKTYGHVEFVEEYDKVSGKVTTSSSGYNSYLYTIRVRSNTNGRWGMSTTYPFLGFVYPVEEFEEDETPVEIKVLFNGKEKTLRSLQHNQENYVRLRDMGVLLDVDFNWSAAKGVYAEVGNGNLNITVTYKVHSKIYKEENYVRLRDYDTVLGMCSVGWDAAKGMPIIAKE